MTITVEFTGICTHVTPPGHGKYRVILVDAHNGAFFRVQVGDEIKERKVPPHIATLKIKPEHITGKTGDLDGLVWVVGEGQWLLRGVCLELQNTTGEACHPQEGCDLPHLSAPDPEASVSPGVTLGEQAAAYFDFDHGVMTLGETEHKAITAIFHVEPAEAPALKVTCFWNRKVSWIHLTPDARIDVGNVNTEHVDTYDDFLLHYRVFDSVPADPFVPTEEGKKKNREEHPNDISIGCSNSQYP